MCDRTWISEHERYEVIPEWKLNELQARHTALVEAVEELMSLDYEDNFDQGKFFKAWNRVEQALAAEKEEA